MASARSTSLLGKIRHPERAVARRHVPASELRDDILTHLRNMCSTRQKSVVTAPDYGVPDVTEMLHSFPEAISIMRKALKHTIEKYEPRLTNVRVNYVQGDESDLIVRFEIVAQLASDERREPVKFETTLEVSGKIDVR